MKTLKDLLNESVYDVNSANTEMSDNLFGNDFQITSNKNKTLELTPTGKGSSFYGDLIRIEKDHNPFAVASLNGIKEIDINANSRVTIRVFDKIVGFDGMTINSLGSLGIDPYEQCELSHATFGGTRIHINRGTNNRMKFTRCNFNTKTLRIDEVAVIFNKCTGDFDTISLSYYDAVPTLKNDWGIYVLEASMDVWERLQEGIQTDMDISKIFDTDFTFNELTIRVGADKFVWSKNKESDNFEVGNGWFIKWEDTTHKSTYVERHRGRKPKIVTKVYQTYKHVRNKN